MMEEVKDVSSVLSVQGDSIKVTEALQDGDTLTFIIISQKLSGTGEYHVDRTYDDFEWLQQHLYSQEDVPGIQGVIFPPLPGRPQVNASAKVMKQLGFLGLEDWQLYCRALETFLRQVSAHSVLSKNQAVELFLTSADPPGRQKIKKNIFNRLSQAMEEMRKEGHKDVDEFFQTERDQNLLLTGSTRTAAEVCQASLFLLLSVFSDTLRMDSALTEISVACGHFSAALHLCVEPGDEPEKKAFTRVCVQLSEVFDSMKKSTRSFAVNDMNTLGLGLDLHSRYQEAEKEMLFRRTCKMVELENAIRNAEKAKPVKKAAMEEVKKATEAEFQQISEVAKQEIVRFKQIRVHMLQKSLIQWCEKQLVTARESADIFSHHLQAFKATV
ncbi:sorting nexin-5 isoform X1 [Kryptolebias marmoratus]|uniref:sorting nexin-5 isoform X1 n=1 Tax=Kryptolebias marmoratus TaxID=37003 RepID=UPI000D52FA64|nr:sorting nexin-5 isoform X1 [Kryptolebias marmoratus]